MKRVKTRRGEGVKMVLQKDHILESNNASVQRSVVKGLNNYVAKGLNRGVVKGLNTRCVRPVGKGTYPQDVFVPWSQTQHLSVRIY
jgi:hypothetical protein